MYISIYAYSEKEYKSFAKFCEVIESFHGRVVAFNDNQVTVVWSSAMNRNHFEEHMFGK